MPSTPARRPSARPTTAAHRDVERRDVVSLAYEAMRRSIIAGDLPSGSRIVERSVAERLCISRTPVRSALHRLQQEGFVAPSGGGGEQRLTVTPLTAVDGRELFLLVGHLEGLAAREAALLPTAPRRALVRRLKALNRALAVESRKKPGINRAYELDEQFHRAYVEGVAGPRVVALHCAVKPQIERYARFYADTLLDQLSLSVAEHVAIIRAIDTGSAASAQRTVESNWHKAADRLARTIRELGERRSWLLPHPR